MTELIDNKREQEANYFAMELLMPEDDVRKQCAAIAKLQDKPGIDLEDTKVIKGLAKRYRVSETIMTIRLADLYFGGIK